MSAEDPGGGTLETISVDNEQDIPIDEDWIHDTAARALRLLGVPSGAMLEVSLVDQDRMAKLKQIAFGDDSPTDVLTFPIDDPADPMPGPLVLGDVVLCPAVAAEQARASGHALTDELALLLVHGILHALGRDHAEPDDELAMFDEQNRLLSAISAERS
jgi:probable rRNA maturation factor